MNIYLTTDAGRSWRPIGPKEVANDGGVDRVQPFFATDATHFWMTVGSVSFPGGRCIDGTCRGSAIESTTYAGRSWHKSYLLGCLQCGTAVSFLNDRVGFAIGLEDTGGYTRRPGPTRQATVGSPGP